MIISAKRNYVFVHIPKTGGTSLATVLEERAAADDILIGDTPKAQRRKKRLANLRAPGRLWKHSTLADVDGLYRRDAFVLTLVRNPWDRMVSYYHWLRAQSFSHSAVRAAKTLSFRDFLKDPQVQRAVRGNPYASYVTAPDGRERCNLFARIEVADDLGPFWQHLGFELSIPYLNKSDRRADWRSYYDVETFEIVRQLAGTDIKRFGYDTQL
ncbi:MAG: sulfotransferase family 2 domain-containing protein [Pseudomonadota bacterium]